SRAVGRAIPSWVSSPAGPSGPHSRCPARHRGVPAIGSAARSIVPLLGPLPDGLLALARRLVVALPLEPHRTVLLLDHVSRVVVRVLVALAVPELPQGRMAGLLQVQRHRVGRGRVLL